MIKVNHDKQKFEIFLDNEKAGEMLYNFKEGSTVNIFHTEIGEGFSGRGLGKKLIEAALDFVRENNFKISASCPYAKAVLTKDDSVADVFV